MEGGVREGGGEGEEKRGRTLRLTWSGNIDPYLSGCASKSASLYSFPSFLYR